MEYTGNDKLKLEDVSFFAAAECLPNLQSSMLFKSGSILPELKESKSAQVGNDLRLYDLTENYKGRNLFIVAMLSVIEKLSISNIEITDEELDLFTRCFKHLVGVRRNQNRKIEALIEKDTITGTNIRIPLLRVIKRSIEKETIEWSHRIIKICRNFIQYELPKNKNAKLFFLKNIADHLRYLYEVESESTLTMSIDDSVTIERVKEAYSAALNSAENDKFPPTDMTYLTFFLNYCVFLHDVLDDREEATRRAKAVLNAALKETEEITENHQKDIILLCQTIKDNLSLWKIEMPDEY